MESKEEKIYVNLYDDIDLSVFFPEEDYTLGFTYDDGEEDILEIETEMRKNNG